MYKIRHRANFKDTIYKFVLPSQELIPYRYQYWKTGDYKMTIVFPVYVILATNYLKNVPSIDIALISTLFVTEQRGCLSYNR